jgi:hypothetical protein
MYVSIQVCRPFQKFDFVPCYLAQHQIVAIAMLQQSMQRNFTDH